MIGNLLVEDTVCERRAAAFDEKGRAVSIFLHRKIGKQWARWGDVHAAQIARLAPEQGGGFACLESGEEIFIRAASLKGVTEGATRHVGIVSEARNGKLARGQIVEVPPHVGDTFETWIAALPFEVTGKEENQKIGDAKITAAFDEALAESVSLPGGGRLRITETPALIAIDIDSAGRLARGRAYDRAHTLNLAAVVEAARQLSLRRLGGAVVVDCVAPLRRDKGTELKGAFSRAFRQTCSRKVEALAPSPFGLMEAVLAWRERPLAHILTPESGSETDCNRLISAVRELETELAQDRIGTHILQLPKNLMQLVDEIEFCRSELAHRYGRRFLIEASQSDIHKVVRS